MHSVDIDEIREAVSEAYSYNKITKIRYDLLNEKISKINEKISKITKENDNGGLPWIHSNITSQIRFSAQIKERELIDCVSLRCEE